MLYVEIHARAHPFGARPVSVRYLYIQWMFYYHGIDRWLTDLCLCHLRGWYLTTAQSKNPFMAGCGILKNIFWFYDGAVFSFRENSGLLKSFGNLVIHKAVPLKKFIFDWVETCRIWWILILPALYLILDEAQVNITDWYSDMHHKIALHN